jgi:FAD/FMN-containing dehydrogenase
MFFGESRLKSSISREAYASDASIYRVRPQKIFCPQSEDEIIEIIKTALDKKIPITARGAGTGLAGGALGTGYIVDCSRLIEIQHISIENKTVTCRPGIIYRDLNLALKDTGLYFPPDPSSGDSCQIGGMLANNSSGPRSVKYGLTSNYVEELVVIGRDGRPIILKKLELQSPEWDRFRSQYPEYG